MPKKDIAKQDAKLNKIQKSIDDLARITAKGFASVEARLADHDGKFSAIDERLNYLEKNIATKEDLQTLKDQIFEEISGHEEIENATIMEMNTRIKALERRVFGRKN